MITDFLLLVAGSVKSVLFGELWTLGLCCLVGLALALASGFGCGAFARLWNKRYQLRLPHYLLCALSAIVTFVFVITFFCTWHIGGACLAMVDSLERHLRADGEWSAAVYAQAYQKVKALGVEDFTGVAPPGAAGSRIPTTVDASRQVVASLYANETLRYFLLAHPFLSKAASLNVKLPTDAVFADVREVLKKQDDYPLDRAINLALQQIRDEVKARISRVVWTVCLVVLFVFLLLQLLIWGFIGWSAYRDIRPAI